ADLIRIDEERKEQEKAAQPVLKGITYEEYLRRKKARQGNTSVEDSTPGCIESLMKRHCS
ncbi:MAG: hypothetical protein LBF62_03725, partial [Tannerellaceae bacterium]|nr:hypothetical protein [Tannerellaceae bacterium]